MAGDVGVRRDVCLGRLGARADGVLVSLRYIGFESTRWYYFLGLLVCVGLVASALTRLLSGRLLVAVLLGAVALAAPVAALETLLRGVWTTPRLPDLDRCGRSLDGVDVTRCYSDVSGDFRPGQFYVAYEGRLSASSDVAVPAHRVLDATCSCFDEQHAERIVSEVACTELTALSTLQVDGVATCAICQCGGDYEYMSLLKLGSQGSVAGFRSSGISRDRANRCVLRSEGCFAWRPPRPRASNAVADGAPEDYPLE